MELIYLYTSSSIAVDKFRGFTTSQLEAIRRDQAGQISALHVQQKAEKELLEEHARQAAMFNRTGSIIIIKISSLPLSTSYPPTPQLQPPQYSDPSST